MKFKIGDKIKLTNHGQNVYEVVNLASGCYELHCIEFYSPENLGDDIHVYNYNHLTWVASFFDYLFKKVS